MESLWNAGRCSGKALIITTTIVVSEATAACCLLPAASDTRTSICMNRDSVRAQAPRR